MRTKHDDGFGQFLKKAIKNSMHVSSMKRMTAKILAQELQYSESLVSLWINDKRLPTDPEIINKIKLILNLSPEEMQTLDRLYTEELNAINKEKRKNKMLIAQKMRGMPVSTDIFQHDPATIGNSDFIRAYLSATLPHNGEVIDTVPNFHFLINQILIAGAIQADPGVVILTYFGESLRIIRSQVHWQHMLKAMQLLLQHGWKITCLVRIGQDEERTVKFIQEYIRNFSLGELLDIYYIKYEYHLPPQGYVFVSGIGTIHMFANHNKEDVDAGIFFSDSRIMNTTQVHLENLLSVSHPLIRWFHTRREQIEWEDSLSNGESEGTNRILFKEWFSLLTRPGSFYEKDSEWLKGRTEEDKENSIRRYEQRIKAFKQHVLFHPYIDVYPIRVVNDFVFHGRYPHSKFEVHNAFRPLLPRLRIEQLQNIVKLLTTYELYDIILIEEEQEKAIFQPMYWEVVMRAGVYFQIYRNDNGLSTPEEFRFLITDPSIVAAFHTYALKLIKSTPYIRPKTEVISYFNDQIDYIERKLLP